MKYLFILLTLLSTVLGKEACLLSKNAFYDYASQEVNILLPKTFAQGINTVEVILSQPNMPSGFMVPVIFDLEKFDGKIMPEVISGYPLSTIDIKEKGSYTFKIKVNLVYKSSCGGIQFSNLSTKKIAFEVK